MAQRSSVPSSVPYQKRLRKGASGEFTHRVGHGIGLDGHEWTYLVRGNQTPLAPGMCFSNEPGVYLYGEFGIRLEDCFFVTEEGGELFTRQSPPIDDPFGRGA